MFSKTKNKFYNIPGFEKYKINKNGDVYSSYTNIILKKSKSSKIRPYYQVILYKNSKRYCYKIHVLMMMTFFNYKPNGKNNIVIDHINNNSLDNRLENLQIITQRENKTKDTDFSKKTSKYIGVYFHKKAKKFQATIRIGKDIHLGLFEDEEKAGKIYKLALENIHTFNNAKQFRQKINNLYVLKYSNKNK